MFPRKLSKHASPDCSHVPGPGGDLVFEPNGSPGGSDLNRGYAWNQLHWVPFSPSIRCIDFVTLSLEKEGSLLKVWQTSRDGRPMSMVALTSGPDDKTQAGAQSRSRLRQSTSNGDLSPLVSSLTEEQRVATTALPITSPIQFINVENTTRLVRFRHLE